MYFVKYKFYDYFNDPANDKATRQILSHGPFSPHSIVVPLFKL